MTARRFLVAVVVLLACAGVATAAALRSGDRDAPRLPLDDALAELAAARGFEGVTADFTVENRLLPEGTIRPPLSGLLSAGARGRVWIAADGRFRVDLRTSLGAARIVADGRRAWLTAPFMPAAITLPLEGVDRLTRPSLGALRLLVRQARRYATLSDARTGELADRPTATVRVRPRDDGGLLGAAELTWDRARGVPLRAAIFTTTADEPVLELRATHVRFGPVSDRTLAVRPGADVPRIDGADPEIPRGRLPTGRTTLPRELAGLRRRVAQRVPGGAVGVYGSGLGTIVVVQAPATGQAETLVGPDLGLPAVNLDGATGIELATALGTGVAVTRGGQLHVVGGLVPPLVVENAARELLRAG